MPTGRGGQDIALTAREFAVLVYTADRVGDTARKSDILDAVWEDAAATDADINLVEVHVTALRRKIDRPFGRAGIETVRGVGYRLRPDGG
jgi:DNA-binding response OmpR family regulator